jgi:hypothetical protein
MMDVASVLIGSCNCGGSNISLEEELKRARLFIPLVEEHVWDNDDAEAEEDEELNPRLLFLI